MKREETIKLDSLAIGYTAKHSVKVVAEGITATIRSGEMTCLLGVNGAGKSTLLRTLSGFLPPLSGKIDIMGKPLKSYRETDLAKVISKSNGHRLAKDTASVARSCPSTVSEAAMRCITTTVPSLEFANGTDVSISFTCSALPYTAV